MTTPNPLVEQIARAVCDSGQTITQVFFWDTAPDYYRESLLKLAECIFSILTQSLGEDRGLVAELADISEKISDTTCVLRGKRMLDHAVRTSRAAIALDKAAAHLIAYEATVAELTKERDDLLHDLQRCMNSLNVEVNAALTPHSNDGDGND